MKVTVDESRCIASGVCVMKCPEVFDQRDEDGVAVVLAPDPPAELQAQVHLAADGCPSMAIRLDK